MADFQTHIGTSTVLGIGWGVVGYNFGIELECCMLAGGLCSVSGMLPDLDSDSGTPVREMSTFLAAIVPMLMLERFQSFQWSREMMAFVAMFIYIFIRFGLVELFKRYTVHRGMWHSIPACAACGLLAFLIVGDADLNCRFYKSLAVVLGFMSHLVLDEIWSVSLRSGRLNIKRSFGTAIKFWSKDRWANFSTYAKVAVLALFAIGDPMLMEHYGYESRFGEHTAQNILSRALEFAGIQPVTPTLQR